MKWLALVVNILLGYAGGVFAQGAPSCDLAPDVVYYGGTIITMDPNQPVAEAMAVGADTITAVGTDAAILALALPGCGTLLSDLGSLTILPGFNESHAHWFSWPEHICSVTGEITYPTLDEIMQKLSANGWTSMSELNFGRPDFAPAHFDNAMNLDSRGELSVRVTGYWGTLDDVSMIDVLADSGRVPATYYSDRVHAPGVKMYVDDPFGASDILSQEEVDVLVQKSHAGGWQVAAHAVNQSAVEKILNAYEMVLGTDSNNDRRHRIEHAVKVTDDQLARMKAKGIIASIQLLGPPDWPAQADFGDRFLGSNPEWVLRWRDFVASEHEGGGAVNTGSSDAPFNDAPCDPSPFRLIYQAVTRDGFVDRTPADWELAQQLSIEQAIKLLTVDGAYATFEEDRKGSLETGKWADFVVVSANPLKTTAPEDLLDIEVYLTAVGAKIEYCSEAMAGDLCSPAESFVVDVGVVTASQFLPDQTPDRAFDGDTDTNWGAGADAPQWIEIVLDEPVRIGGMDLWTDQFPDGQTTHQIWAKTDEPDAELELIHEFTGNTATNQTLSYDAPDDLKVYKTFRVLTTDSPSWVSWREIRFRRFSATSSESEIPKHQAILRHFPNPVRTSATFSFEIFSDGATPARLHQGKLILYDVFGRLVRRWEVPTQAYGVGQIKWDGTDVLGKPVASGIYIYRLTTGGNATSERLVVVR